MNLTADIRNQLKVNLCITGIQKAMQAASSTNLKKNTQTLAWVFLNSRNYFFLPDFFFAGSFFRTIA